MSACESNPGSQCNQENYIKNSNTIGNRNRYILACSAMSQPAAMPPCAPVYAQTGHCLLSASIASSKMFTLSINVHTSFISISLFLKNLVFYLFSRPESTLSFTRFFRMEQQNVTTLRDTYCGRQQWRCNM